LVIGKEQADLAGSRNHLIKSRAIAEVFKFGERFEPTRAAFLKGSTDGQRAAQARLSTAADRATHLTVWDALSVLCHLHRKHLAHKGCNDERI